MTKLSLFIYSMGPGGCERVVSNLLPYLAQKYEIHLVLMSEVIAYKIPSQIKIHFIEKSDPYESSISKNLRLLFALPMLMLKYKRLCEKIGIDKHFVVMNRPCYIAVGARILGLKGTMIINESSCPSRIYKHGLSGFVNRLLLKFFYPKADLIIANARGNADDLIKNFNISEKKIRVVYNALNLCEINRLKAEPLDTNFRPFFINIGRLDDGKNQAMLIRAIAAIDDKRATLGILGKGNLQNELENLIDRLEVGDRVKLLGVDKNPFRHIANASCFVCSSRFEGFSNVLIEALACEKLLITTDHQTGARELVGENKYGILTPVDDEKAMKNAMIRALNEPEFVLKYERVAYERAKDFDSEKISDEVIKMLESVYE